jgi:hypothetical protein
MGKGNDPNCNFAATMADPQDRPEADPVAVMIDAFSHKGPGGDQALPAEIVREFDLQPGDAKLIAGCLVTRQADGHYDVEGDANLMSPWVAVQSIKSLRAERLMETLRAVADSVIESDDARLLRMAALNVERYGKPEAFGRAPLDEISESAREALSLRGVVQDAKPDPRNADVLRYYGAEVNPDEAKRALAGAAAALDEMGFEHDDLLAAADRVLRRAGVYPTDLAVAQVRALSLLDGKLEAMELHDDTGHPTDEGYMAAWREVRSWADQEVGPDRMSLIELLDSMKLHDKLANDFDEGYMAAIDELREWYVAIDAGSITRR